MARDFLRGFEIGLERGLLDVALSGGAAGIHIDGNQRLGRVHYDIAAGAELDDGRMDGVDLAFDLKARKERNTRIAIEPYARRHWPDSLISWNRLLSGRVRDPLVASHTLSGSFLFFATFAIFTVVDYVVSAAPIPPTADMMHSLTSTTGFAAGLIGSVQSALIIGTVILLLVVLLRLAFRRVWIADSVGALVSAAALTTVGLDFTSPFRFIISAAGYLLFFLGLVWLIRRFGLLSVFAFWFVDSFFLSIPLPRLTAWYGTRVLVGFGILLTLSAWALWVVLSAQKGSQLESQV